MARFQVRSATLQGRWEDGGQGGRQTPARRGEEIFMSRKLRSTAAALVFASLLVPAAFAQNRPSRPAPARTVGVWEWLVGMFVPAVSTVGTSGKGIVAKEGSSMDPNGGRSTASSSSFSTTDVGSQMHSNG